MSTTNNIDYSTAPKVVRAKSTGKYWIPPFPPHWDIWVGDYVDMEEAKEERAGMEACINSPQWKMMMVEMEDEFDEKWEELEQLLEEEIRGT